MSTEILDQPETVLELFRAAWDAADAEAFGELFTSDATYVIVLGDLLVGREAIQRTHHDVFTKWQAGTKMLIRPLNVTMLSDEAAVALTVGGIGREHIVVDKFQTFTLVRVDGKWLIAAYQNTEMSSRSRSLYNPAS